MELNTIRYYIIISLKKLVENRKTYNYDPLKIETLPKKYTRILFFKNIPIFKMFD